MAVCNSNAVIVQFALFLTRFLIFHQIAPVIIFAPIIGTVLVCCFLQPGFRGYNEIRSNVILKCQLLQINVLYSQMKDFNLLHGNIYQSKIRRIPFPDLQQYSQRSIFSRSRAKHICPGYHSILDNQNICYLVSQDISFHQEQEHDCLNECLILQSKTKILFSFKITNNNWRKKLIKHLPGEIS